METTEITVHDKWSVLMQGEELPQTFSQLPEDKAVALMNQFLPYMEAIVQLEGEFKGLSVDSEDDEAGMARAKKARLAFKKTRTNAEKVRKEEKQWANIVGQSIDFLGRTIRTRCEHWENEYQLMETYRERMYAERKETLRLERENLLAPYVDDLDGWDLANMTPEAFDRLLSVSKIAHEQEEAEAERARQEETLRLEAERLERERIQAENERLRAEQEALKAELAAKQQAEEEQRQAEVAKQVAAQGASDKDKLRALYLALQAVQIPELQDEACTSELQARMNNLLILITEYGKAA